MAFEGMRALLEQLQADAKRVKRSRDRAPRNVDRGLPRCTSSLEYADELVSHGRAGHRYLYEESGER